MSQHTGWMDEDQLACYQFLCDTMGGAHHVPPVYEHGAGISCSVHEGISTFDYNQLTRLVIGCHDRAIRLEIRASGPRLLRLGLWQRQRDGSMYERHPTIEEAIKCYRQQHPQTRPAHVIKEGR